MENREIDTKSDIAILPRSFYNRNTLAVAKELLGKVLVKEVEGERLSGRIVEVEAYIGDGDPACHAFRGKTKRNAVMFGPPGYAYVYFTYGMHYCLNFVTEEEGKAGAVLIRALEPLEGVKWMEINRGMNDIYNLCSGPAKLTQALLINKGDNGRSLFERDFFVSSEKSGGGFEMGISPRIGIRAGVELPWRFYIKGSRFLSRREK